MTRHKFSPRQIRPAAAIAAMASLLLPGCASLSGLDGAAGYGCKAPQGVQCESVSGNYTNALAADPPGRIGLAWPADGGKSGMKPGPAVPPPAALPASALRSPPRVLRLWFKPWEDADRDLHGEGHVYVRIDDGRWLTGHAQPRIKDARTPVRAPRAAAAASDPARPPATPDTPAGDGKAQQ